ncbi:MAG: hypothetical protein R3291_05580 [Thermoplasmata archaeon]|nr:hypothetical protein [Thermoplasmata archaeon]
MWGLDPVKLAMKPFPRFFGLFGVEVELDASLVASHRTPRGEGTC